MRTIRTKVYKFNELSKEGQQKALENYQDINVFHYWWEDIYLDIQVIEAHIESFDLDRKEITGKFYNGGYTTAKNIIEHHGENCDTYLLAKQFIIEFDEAEKEIRAQDFYDYFNDREKQFLNDLLKCYLKILEIDLEYRLSDEAIKETLIFNEYEFLSTGKMFS